MARSTRFNKVTNEIIVDVIPNGVEDATLTIQAALTKAGQQLLSAVICSGKTFTPTFSAQCFRRLSIPKREAKKECTTPAFPTSSRC